MHVLFSIYGTPSWANGGKGPNVAPTSAIDLRNFALAAARRYSGKTMGADGRLLPAVKEWLAWNEPNNPVFLTPQWKKNAVGKFVIVSATNYAKICNAVYSGVHATLQPNERVACGVTAPRGNNNPNSSRPSVSPLAFLRAVKAAGLKTFDAWAHHPYYAGPSDQPTTKPVTAKGAPATAVTLGNISDLIKEVTRLYGNKRIWITEYGYQTNPPDKLYGVTYAKQAAYLKQAFAIARANPRIDMMLWFLLKDDPNLERVAVGSHHVAWRARSRVRCLYEDGCGNFAREQLAVERVDVVDQPLDPIAIDGARPACGPELCSAEPETQPGEQGRPPTPPRRRARRGSRRRRRKRRLRRPRRASRQPGSPQQAPRSRRPACLRSPTQHQCVEHRVVRRDIALIADERCRGRRRACCAPLFARPGPGRRRRDIGSPRCRARAARRTPRTTSWTRLIGVIRPIQPTTNRPAGMPNRRRSSSRTVSLPDSRLEVDAEPDDARTSPPARRRAPPGRRAPRGSPRSALLCAGREAARL